MAHLCGWARGVSLASRKKPVDRSHRRTGWSSRQPSELGDQLGNGSEQVLDQAVVGDAEDRRLLVLVDRNDDLRVFHAGKMLDRAADADRDIQLRRDDLAGLADLPVVRRVAGVYGGTARAERGAQLVGKRCQ